MSRIINRRTGIKMVVMKANLLLAYICWFPLGIIGLHVSIIRIMDHIPTTTVVYKKKKKRKQRKVLMFLSSLSSLLCLNTVLGTIVLSLSQSLGFFIVCMYVCMYLLSACSIIIWATGDEGSYTRSHWGCVSMDGLRISRKCQHWWSR